MPPLLLLLQLYVVACVAGVAVWAGPAETVVGVAGRRVSLPCRVAAAKRKGVHVCWGRGEPAFFSCHNVLVNAVGQRLMYKSSYRYSVSSAPSEERQLSIFNVRLSDSGLYHCRVQLPGPFNDKTFSVLLIVIPRAGNLNTPPTIKGGSTDAGTGSDVTQSVQLWEGSVDDTTGPVVARVRVWATQLLAGGASWCFADGGVTVTEARSAARRPQSANVPRKHPQNGLRRLQSRSDTDRRLQNLEVQSESSDWQQREPIRRGRGRRLRVESGGA